MAVLGLLRPMCRWVDKLQKRSKRSKSAKRMMSWKFMEDISERFSAASAVHLLGAPTTPETLTLEARGSDGSDG